MKRRFLCGLVLGSLAASGHASAQTTPSVEPVVAAVEPVALRTALARPLAGARRTVIVPAREDKVLGLTHYSREEYEAAGLDWEKFMKQASEAATRLLVSIKPVVARDAAGQVAYVKLHSDRPFTASMVISPRLVPLFQSVLGDRIVALIPERETVYLFSRNFSGFQQFGQKIIDDHADAVYPCSIEAFEISREGLKCIGGFDDGAGEVPDLEPGELPRKTPYRPSPTEVPRRREIPAAPAKP